MGIFDQIKIPEQAHDSLFSERSHYFEKRAALVKPVPVVVKERKDCAEEGKTGIAALVKKAKKAQKEADLDNEEDEEVKNDSGGSGSGNGITVKKRRNKSVIAETKEEEFDDEGDDDDDDFKNKNDGKSTKTTTQLTLNDNKKTEEEIENEMKRTIFVGNVAVKTKAKELVLFFKALLKNNEKAEIESVRIRSVPLKASTNEKDAKIPKRAKILAKKNEVNDLSKSGCNAYVVWKREKDAQKAVKKGNMQKFNGRTLRVDFAAKSSTTANLEDVHANGVTYDRLKSVFVGNLPFDVSDEEVIEIFTNNKEYSELRTELEAVRVVRDKSTRTGKGIAFVLFKTAKAARTALLLDGFEMGKRELRITKVGVVAPKRGNEISKTQVRVGKTSTTTTTTNNNNNNTRFIKNNNDDIDNKRKSLNAWEGGRSAKGSKIAKFEKKSTPFSSSLQMGKGNKNQTNSSSEGKPKKKKERTGKRPAVALRKAKAKAGI